MNGKCRVVYSEQPLLGFNLYFVDVSANYDALNQFNGLPVGQNQGDKAIITYNDGTGYFEYTGGAWTFVSFNSNSGGSADNLGNHSATQNIDLNNNQLINLNIPEYNTRAEAIAAIGTGRFFRYTEVPTPAGSQHDFKHGIEIT